MVNWHNKIITDRRDKYAQDGSGGGLFRLEKARYEPILDILSKLDGVSLVDGYVPSGAGLLKHFASKAQNKQEFLEKLDDIIDFVGSHARLSWTAEVTKDVMKNDKTPDEVKWFCKNQFDFAEKQHINAGTKLFNGAGSPDEIIKHSTETGHLSDPKESRTEEICLLLSGIMNEDDANSGVPSAALQKYVDVGLMGGGYREGSGGAPSFSVGMYSNQSSEVPNGAKLACNLSREGDKFLICDTVLDPELKKTLHQWYDDRDKDPKSKRIVHDILSPFAEHMSEYAHINTYEYDSARFAHMGRRRSSPQNGNPFVVDEFRSKDNIMFNLMVALDEEEKELDIGRLPPPQAPQGNFAQMHEKLSKIMSRPHEDRQPTPHRVSVRPPLPKRRFTSEKKEGLDEFARTDDPKDPFYFDRDPEYDRDDLDPDDVQKKADTLRRIKKMSESAGPGGMQPIKVLPSVVPDLSSLRKSERREPPKSERREPPKYERREPLEYDDGPPPRASRRQPEDEQTNHLLPRFAVKDGRVNRLAGWKPPDQEQDQEAPYQKHDSLFKSRRGPMKDYIHNTGGVRRFGADQRPREMMDLSPGMDRERILRQQIAQVKDAIDDLSRNQSML